MPNSLWIGEYTNPFFPLLDDAGVLLDVDGGGLFLCPECPDCEGRLQECPNCPNTDGDVAEVWEFTMSGISNGLGSNPCNICDEYNGTFRLYWKGVSFGACNWETEERDNCDEPGAGTATTGNPRYSMILSQSGGVITMQLFMSAGGQTDRTWRLRTSDPPFEHPDCLGPNSLIRLNTISANLCNTSGSPNPLIVTPV